MVVWPSIAATGLGRLVGRMAAVPYGVGRVFTLGNLLALVSIPLALAAFAWKLMPYVARRYRLTNKRILVQRGLLPVEERAIGLGDFDAIQIEVLPGQRWLRAGDLVFRRSGQEVFRLPGVCSPASFRRTCLEVQRAVLSVREVLQRQAAEVTP